MLVHSVKIHIRISLRSLEISEIQELRSIRLSKMYKEAVVPVKAETFSVIAAKR